MKCPNCGAEIKEDTKVCDFCGSGITIDMQREQEQLKKKGCPSCGSTNISFSREKQGEVKGKKGTAVVRATVGICKDCGYTWQITGSASTKKSNKMVWWVLGWLFFFPAPVMVLIWRKKCKWDIKVKIGVTVAFWLLIFLIGGSDNSSEKSENKEESIAVEQTTDNKGEDVTKAEPEKNKGSVIVETSEFNINELPVMNGTKTERIGTYSMCYMLSADCTDEEIAKWYQEVKEKDYNWSIIRYADADDKGIYANNGIIEKDVQFDEDGALINSEGETIYTVNEDGTISSLE